MNKILLAIMLLVSVVLVGCAQKPSDVIIEKNTYNIYNCNEELGFNIGDVYYNLDTNQFSQIRYKTNSGYMLTSADYYGDARTTISQFPVNIKYAENNLVKIHNIKDYAIYNGFGWKVGKENVTVEVTYYNSAHQMLEDLNCTDYESCWYFDDGYWDFRQEEKSCDDKIFDYVNSVLINESKIIVNNESRNIGSLAVWNVSDDSMFEDYDYCRTDTFEGCEFTLCVQLYQLGFFDEVERLNSELYNLTEEDLEWNYFHTNPDNIEWVNITLETNNTNFSTILNKMIFEYE